MIPSEVRGVRRELVHRRLALPCIGLLGEARYGRGMATLDYAAEKFETAVDGMATSRDKLEERVVSAYVDDGILRIKDLPGVDDELQRRLADLHARFATVDISGDEGTAAASIAQLDAAGVDDVARLIVDVARRIQTAIVELGEDA